MKEIIPVSKNDPCGEPGQIGPIYPDYVNRMIFERNDLREKVTKLNKFIDGDKFSELTIVKQDLLVAQYNVMLTYLGILEMRLKVEGVKL